MKKIYWFMIILSSIIIILSCVISIKETDYEEAVIGRLTIECMMDDKAIRLVLWKDESEDRFYLFLPSWYAKKDKIHDIPVRRLDRSIAVRWRNRKKQRCMDR